LIEPQSIFVPYLQRVLSNAGFEVIATSAAVDARDITAHAPDAIFVDVDYLERSGPTALCRIREVARDVQLIALSESTDATFAATCYICGANAVYSKGDGEEKLVRALRKAVATP
jgi:DNA-binding NarL/FixJ family response regulator